MCSGDSRDGVRGVRSLRMREREREREREEGGGKERPVTFEKFSMLYTCHHSQPSCSFKWMEHRRIEGNKTLFVVYIALVCSFNWLLHFVPCCSSNVYRAWRRKGNRQIQGLAGDLSPQTARLFLRPSNLKIWIHPLSATILFLIDIH